LQPAAAAVWPALNITLATVRLLPRVPLNKPFVSIIPPVLFLGINKRRYKEKVMANTQMVRIVIHPKDSENALQDQKEMINGLKDINYNFLTYKDIEELFG
jgi:hypothetical protein